MSKYDKLRKLNNDSLKKMEAAARCLHKIADESKKAAITAHNVANNKCKF